ncbi:MAG: YqaJ viral recombinase family protein [Neisseriaceae bacterium]|nr:YqaJ viral recombinase family protein [Neisseriaceae bacterium]MBR3426153.1 YqaJ viral recombinase family protein [Neisseriaceae bacterium]
MFADLQLLHCQQGTDEWKTARLGIPTASRFHKIMTTKCKQSQQKQNFLYELLEEHITQIPYFDFQSEDMKRGVLLESTARQLYEKTTKNQVYEVGGVWYQGKHKILASPDGLMPNLRKGLEIKCPKINNHIDYVHHQKVPTKYLLQIQGCLWITGYKSWDFVSFCPEYKKQPFFMITVARDEHLIQQMKNHICQFSDELEQLKIQLQKKNKKCR